MKGLKGVFERPVGSNIWWIRYIDASGRERREKAGSKSVSIQLYRKRKQQALEGKKLPEKLRARSILFDELIDDAVEHCERQVPPGEDGRYSCKIELIRDGLGSGAVDEISPQQISRWLHKLKQSRDWRPATANRYKAFVSLAFRLGIENGKCNSNPARQVKRLRENNERIRFLSAEEESKLRDAIHSECAERMVELDVALNTGMRKGEQYRLNWRDVDLESRRITLWKTKNGSVRHIPLNTSALVALRTIRGKSGAPGPVFTDKKGSDPLQNPRYWWDSVLDRAGIKDFHWHDLRHTFASRCIMAGVDLRTLQQLLGHKTLQMVVRYSHLSQSHELAAVEKLCSTNHA
ncbi:MAG TPA: site-specific integrase [Terracidiphilus sp.]|jgi:integrase